MRPPIQYQYFISKQGDIVFSVVCGVAAYFQYEREHPREWKLTDLVQRKIQRMTSGLTEAASK
ncbi:hypothetical protein BGW42_004479 [Actinomortierella wolfii]|nr:hypothetical protein BGW42_004479 [Actinomortierella wolfii]